MKYPITKSSLAQSVARLIELMQALNYGRIEMLYVQGGQPVFDPLPRIIQKLKMGGDNAPRPEVCSADFRLKEGVVELLQIIERLGNGEIRSIEVRCGLPISVEIDWPSDAPTLRAADE